MMRKSKLTKKALRVDGTTQSMKPGVKSKQFPSQVPINQPKSSFPKKKVAGSTLKSTKNSGKSNPNLPTAGIIDDVWSTGKSVAKTVSDIAEGNPMGLLEIPNSIVKVIDTTKNIIRNVSSSDAKEKVTVQNHTDLKTVQDTIVMDKLKKHVPVVTTTQIPSSYSTEYTQAPLQITERTLQNGRKITNVQGSFALPPCADDLVVGQVWNYKLRLSPIGGLVFGPRVDSIANTFQMWKLNSVTAQFIPTQGTDFVGNYTMNFMEGADYPAHYNSAVDYQDVSQRECIQPGTLKTGTSLTYRGKGDWLFCSNYNGESARFFVSTTFGVLTYNYSLPPGPAANKVGFVFLTFDIDFMAQAESPYNFSSQMERILFGVYLNTCGYDIKFTQWLALVYHTFFDIVEHPDEMTKLLAYVQEDSACWTNVKAIMGKDYSELCAALKICHAFSDDLDKNRMVRVLRQCGFPLEKEKGTPDQVIHLSRASISVIVIVMTLYFRGSVVSDLIGDINEVIAMTAKRAYRARIPMKKHLLEIDDSEEDEEEDPDLEIVEKSSKMKL